MCNTSLQVVAASTSDERQESVVIGRIVVLGTLKPSGIDVEIDSRRIECRADIRDKPDSSRVIPTLETDYSLAKRPLWFLNMFPTEHTVRRLRVSVGEYMITLVRIHDTKKNHEYRRRDISHWPDKARCGRARPKIIQNMESSRILTSTNLQLILLYF